MGAGLALLVDDKTYVRLERFGVYRRQQFEDFGSWELRQNGRMTFSRTSPRLTAKEIYLRLERRGDTMLGSVSQDGMKWIELPSIGIILPRKVKLGVDVVSTSSRTFAPSFDQFQLKQDQGEMVRVDWPTLPASAVVAVKPPPSPRPRRGPRFSNKLAVPNETTLDDKRKQLQVMYGEDYKNMPKRALASRLFDDSKKQGDIGLSYVMLNEACDLAAQEGDLTAALRAASELGTRFAVNPLEAKCFALEQTLPATSAKDKSAYRLLTQKALLYFDRAVINEDFERGARLLEVAKAAAKANMNTALKKMVDHSAKQLAAVQTEYEAVKPAAAKLASNPQDEESNLALGKFRCFALEDWEGGLPLLQRGSDAALRELAQKDLAAPEDAAERAPGRCLVGASEQSGRQGKDRLSETGLLLVSRSSRRIG